MFYAILKVTGYRASSLEHRASCSQHPIMMKFKTLLIDSLFLVFVSGLVFYGSLDIYFLSENIGHIKTAVENFRELAFTNYYFRPLYALSLRLDYGIWGVEPAGYHLSNLLLHTLNTLLAYLLGRQVLKNRFAALIGAFFFLLHPIHSLSIFWLSGRTDMLCALFYLSGLIAFIRYFQGKEPRFQTLGAGLFALAMLAKEMALSFPFIVIAYVLIFEASPLKERARKSLRMSAPYFLILLVFILVRIIFVSGALFSSKDHAALAPFQLLKNSAAYLGLLVIPGGHIEIARFLKSHPTLFVILAFAGLAIFLFLLKRIRHSPPLLFCTLFILITLLPVLRLLMRWYLYLPSLGFCLALGYALQRLHEAKQGRARLAYLLAGLVFFGYAFFIFQEQNRWVQAGQLSREFSEKLCRAIMAQQLQKCLLLNLPGELQETPVMLYGVNAFINFRLAQDFGHPGEVKIVPATFISLREKADLHRLIVGKVSAREYLLSLELTESFFIFPSHSDMAFRKSVLQEGLLLQETAFTLRIESLNRNHEADKLHLTVTEPGLAVLYYLNGNFYLEKNLLSPGDVGNESLILPEGGEGIGE